MNPHDMNHLPREATFMMPRLFATVLFGALCFFIGGAVGTYTSLRDVPPCKPVKQVEYPRTKAQIARFVEQVRNRDAGWIR